MNYEERYKQALENFKKIKSANSDNKELVNFIEYEYPELRESEDERIRKSILELVKKSSAILSPMNQNSMIAWLEKQGEQKSSCNEDDEEMIDFMIEFIESLYWRKDLTKRKDEVLSWLKSLKDKVQPQPKQEWSEEDKKMLDSIIDCIDGLVFIDSDQLNWLKSIKPNHWKPSEEQMEAIKFCCANFEEYDALKSLYNDLKGLNLC